MEREEEERKTFSPYSARLLICHFVINFLPLPSSAHSSQSWRKFCWFLNCFVKNIKICLPTRVSVKKYSRIEWRRSSQQKYLCWSICWSLLMQYARLSAEFSVIWISPLYARKHFPVKSNAHSANNEHAWPGQKGSTGCEVTGIVGKAINEKVKVEIWFHQNSTLQSLTQSPNIPHWREHETISIFQSKYVENNPGMNSNRSCKLPLNSRTWRNKWLSYKVDWQFSHTSKGK